MARTRRWILLGLLLAAPALFADDAPQAQVARHKSRKAHKAALKPLVLPPLPSGPLSQVPMDQIPAAPAKVSYQDGLLAIYAQNSTLGEILRDVRKLTGAAIEIPQGAAANERVVTHLGPGAPRDVLSGLLNGSSFNYVMMGSASDPAAISSVILTAKTASMGQTQTAATVYQNSPGAMPPNRFPPQPFGQPMIQQQPAQAIVQQANTETDDTKDEEENPDENADNPDDPAQAQPGQAGAEVQEQQVQDPNQPNAGPRTPEQILEMLRRQPQPGTPIIPPGGVPPQQ